MHTSKHTRSPAPASPRSVINAIVSSEEQGGGTFSHPGQARVTRVALALGKVRGLSGLCRAWSPEAVCAVAALGHAVSVLLLPLFACAPKPGPLKTTGS